MPEIWYEFIGPDIPLTQGDLVFDCPVPRSFLDSLLKQRGHSRFRLLPLSQAFARFFIRVGLTISIEKKWQI